MGRHLPGSPGRWHVAKSGYIPRADLEDGMEQMHGGAEFLSSVNDDGYGPVPGPLHVFKGMACLLAGSLHEDAVGVLNLSRRLRLLFERVPAVRAARAGEHAIAVRADVALGLLALWWTLSRKT